MKDYKFRAWDKEKGVWYKPTHEAYRGELFELMVGFSGDLLAHTMNKVEHQSLWPDRFILMQWTGLVDKNGKEVYEGDVVEHKYYGKKQVQWTLADNGEGAFQYAGYDFEDMDVKTGIIDWEIIGNIWENPELLKKTK